MAFCALIFLFPQGNAKAQIFGNATSSEPTKPTCELNKALDNLLTIKDSNLAGLTRDRAEFKARKEVLIQTVICAQEEIDSTKNRLNELAPATGIDRGLSLQFAGDLDAAILSYEAYSGRIATTTGLLEVKDLASEILAWRNKYYLPLLQQVNDFILLVTSERAHETAQARFEKISNSLSILRLSQIYGIKTSLESAAKLTKSASILNTEARIIVNGYVRTVATSTATSTEIQLEANSAATSSMKIEIATGTLRSSLATSTATSTIEEGEENPPNVMEVVKESLGALKLAYGEYLKISGLVKQILGL